MNINNPLVSVIINCFNGDEFLEKALSSVSLQTYANWEIIFWDNCSSDSSKNIFNNFKKNDSRFNYYLAPNHTVLYEARNYAIEKARGDIIAFLDVDDWWVPTKLEKQIPKFSNKKIGLVCSSYYLFNERGSNSFIEMKGPFPSGNVIEQLITDYFIHISTLLIRKEILNNLEYICDHRFNIIGDLDLVIRIMNNNELYSVDQPLAYYRWHKSNTGFTTNFQISDELKIWVAENKNKFSKYPYFKIIEKKALWYEIIKLIHDNNKIKALKLSYHMPFKNFIKVLFASLVPNKIIKKYL